MKIKRPFAVYVRWRDSAGFGRMWNPRKEIISDAGPLVCHLVGYLMARNKKRAVFSLCISGEAACQTLSIPAECIDKIIYLKEGKSL